MSDETEEQAQVFDWQNEMEEAGKRPDILPKLPIGEAKIGAEYRLRFDEAVPRFIKYEEMDRKTGQMEDKSFPVINVTNIEDGKKYSLPLGAKTLRMGLAKIAAEQDGTLLGVSVIVSKAEANLKQWGKKPVYNVQKVQAASEAV